MTTRWATMRSIGRVGPAAENEARDMGSDLSEPTPQPEGCASVPDLQDRPERTSSQAAGSNQAAGPGQKPAISSDPGAEQLARFARARDWRNQPGPWQGEPDRVEFECEGFPCLMRRQDMGAWCGYVAVPPGHPAHGVDFQSLDLGARGGLSYSSRCFEDICHVPKPGEPDDVWWLGFDCAHGHDFIPQIHLAFASEHDPLKAEPGPFGVTYRAVDYVRGEVEDLARQLREMDGRPA